MNDELPSQLAHQRDALIREIYAAFGDVSRKGAASWSEARVIDRHGSEVERKTARKSDREANWRGLVDAPDWPGGYGSEWSFLDGAGFRYYLAPALVRWVRDGDDCGVGLSLELTDANGEYGRRFLPFLDGRQKGCVRRVIEYQLQLDAPRSPYARKTLQAMLDSHWSSLPLLEE